MLSKKDLKLIGAFIDSGSRKSELNYALVGHGGISAVEAHKYIKFHNSSVQCCDLLVHKKLLKGFESILGKDDDVILESGSDYAFFKANGVSFSLDTFDGDFKYPDIKKIIDKKPKNHFVLSSLNNIFFELTERFCFVESLHLSPLITHGYGDKFDVFYEPMSEDDAGIVHIICSHYVDGEEVMLYTAVIVGREFKSQAK